MTRLVGLFRLLVVALFATVSIQASAQTTVSFAPGWNLVGNSSSGALNVASAFNDTTKVNTVWKWTAPTAKWAMYAPSMSGGDLQTYNTAHGYDVLTAVNGGEGFWVNVKVAFSLQLPEGTAVTAASLKTTLTMPGWNLISIGDAKTPAEVGQAFGTPPITLWAWSAANTNWYFYAASLVAQGANALSNYIASKNYLDFGTNTISPTTGFWVNMMAATTSSSTAPVVSTTTTAGSTSSTAASTTSTTATTATTVTTTTTTTAAVIPPIALASPATTNTANNPHQAFNLVVKAGLTPVTLQNKPVVQFAVIDASGNHVPGLKLVNTTSSAAGLAADPACSQNNVTFAMAKLNAPATGPSTWQNLISRQRYATEDLTPRYSASDTAKRYPSYRYVVAEGTTDPKPTAPTTVTKADGTTVTGFSFANPSTAVTDPATRIVGILEENAAGAFYTYRFAMDVVAPLTMANAVDVQNMLLGKVANNGNVVVKDGTTVHRIGAQLCYADPVTKTRVRINPYMDFTVAADGTVTPVKDANGDITAAKKVVDKASCNECHNPLAEHGGGRVDPNYCVMCHNPGSTDYYTNNPIDLKLMAHRIHRGKELTKDYKVASLRLKYTDASGVVTGTAFSQDIRNCTKCHDGSATATNKTAQGDNWKNVPSRNACGACHDGIDFATGTGTTLADYRAGNASTSAGHQGGAQTSDTGCVFCHTAAAIPVYHLAVTPPNPGNSLLAGGTNNNTNAAWIASNTSRLPAGAIKVTYDISSVSVNASNQPVMVFKLLQDGVAVPFNDKTTKTEIWDNFMGAPSVYFVFAVPQDGISAPADFNASVSSYLRSLWNGTATGTSAGTLTGPDANGYYTATLTGVSIPASAVMLTGGLGYSYSVKNTLPLTQTNLAKYPVVAATGTGLTTGMPNMTGGLIVIAPNVQKVVTGYTGRRAIVEDAKCNKCHQELGVFTYTNFHAGQRNDGTTCAWCHTPNRTSAGWAADSTAFVHAIHGASKRTTKFTWHAATLTDGFWTIGYPGKLSACETCHVPGTYDFSAATSASAVPNRLFRTVGTGRYNNTPGVVTTGGTTAQTALGAFSISPYVTADNTTNYGAGFGYAAATGVITPAADTTLVNSPIAAACFSCHDGNTKSTTPTTVKAHIEAANGVIYGARSTSITKSEVCLLCHGAGKIKDIAVAHPK